jgi:hypothetical protein
MKIARTGASGNAGSRLHIGQRFAVGYGGPGGALRTMVAGPPHSLALAIFRLVAGMDP